MPKTLTVLTIILVQAAFACAQSSSFKLGYIKPTVSDSGCSLARRTSAVQKDDLIFYSLSDETGYINLNGKELKLQPARASKEKPTEQVGDRSWKMYAAGAVRLRIDFTVTRICDPNDEQCEVTNYSATVTVQRRAQRIVVRAIGICGS